MKKLLVSCAALCVIILLGCSIVPKQAAVRSAPVDPRGDLKIIVAGQSNAVGYSLGTPWPSTSMILSYSLSADEWVQATDRLPFFCSLPNDVPGMTCSPWMPLGNLVLESGRWSRVDYTGGGKGGQPIDYWDAGNEGWNILSANIKKTGMDAEWFIWFQGEEDATSNILIDGYSDKLTSLISRVRVLTGKPALKVIVVQLCDNDDRWGHADGYAQIRRIQYNFCVNDSHSFLVQTQGFELQSDGIHLSPIGCNSLAYAIAKLIVVAR